MIKSNIEIFVKDWLDRARMTNDRDFQQKLFHQAFGAVEFACRIYPSHEAETAKWWNEEIRPQFMEIIWRD